MRVPLKLVKVRVSTQRKPGFPDIKLRKTTQKCLNKRLGCNQLGRWRDERVQEVDEMWGRKICEEDEKPMKWGRIN